MSNAISQQLDDPTELRVFMTRPDLENIPVFDWPEGYGVRPYQAGDDRIWWDIHERADPILTHRTGSHREFFGDDEEKLSARQFFLVAPDGESIGTATAWLDSPELGRVHWVAIVPEFQGRGLAKPLLSHILLLLRELGHTSAVLETSTQRPRAIDLYEKFSFAVNN